MVFLLSTSGQLGNRLWQASYFIANAIEHKYEFVHMGFSDYYDFFSENIEKGLHKKKYKCRIYRSKQLTFKHSTILEYVNYSEKFYRHYNFNLPFVVNIKLPTLRVKYDLSSDRFVKLAKKKIAMIDGWPFIDYSALRKHSKTIKEIFTPNAEYLNEVNQIKNKEFAKYDKVIGIHIRRGDYATFLNGMYFYDFSDYAHLMKEIKNFPEFRNLKLGYLLSSNEKINEEDFNEFNVIKSTGKFIEDLYLLSNCNLIVGPPSSFSCWAAFYGGAPLIFVNHNDAKINESEVFHVGETFPY
ncbi:MAG TPA: alpha-1,2-fucosyltransferase [Hanamia sp.]|nr:alpha-1,2-fucosyltransferase [Hanamia sp.]